MNPELIYLLKVNIAIVVFYGFYRLFFHKDTFFKWRRIALLSFLFISFAYPLFNIQNWVKQQEPMVALVDIYSTVIRPEISAVPFSPVIQSNTAPELAEQIKISWQTIITIIINYLYFGIVFILLIRLLLQLISLVKLWLQTRIRYINGIKIRVPNNNSDPFSFFKWIFINPEEYSTEELKEILMHENTHAKQWHSIDVVLSEVLCIACWFNPFMWLMKREIRSNLEYLADNKVIETGHDCRAYQYHLLELAHTKKVATLYNNFNVLPLKKRIKMMNKKRTKQIGRAKYIIFPFLAVALLLISNIEAVARTTEKVIDEIIVSNIETTETAETVVMVDQEDPVFEIVDQMPQYPGGQAALMKYINENIKYPVNAFEKKIQGRVILQYVVNTDGSLSNIKLVRSVDPDLDAEAIRVISGMPKWIPGKHKGETVRVKYTIPVQFKLSKEDIKKTEIVADENGIYEITNKMPEFPGGQKGLMEFLNTNIEYPKSAKERSVQGRVIIQFVVSETGEVQDPVIVRSVDPELDAEALRVIKISPKWTPAEVTGVGPVKCKYTVPVTFRFQ